MKQKTTILLLKPILPPKKDGSLCGNFPRVSKENSAHSFTEGSEDTKKYDFDITINDGWCVWKFKLKAKNAGDYSINDIMDVLYKHFEATEDEGKFISSTLEPSVTEENQEELLKKLFDMVLDVKNGKDDWKRDFTITRKPKAT